MPTTKVGKQMQVSCILIWVRVCNVIVKYAEIYMQVMAA